MINRQEIEKLASLARITIPENEFDKVVKDVESILSYVNQINEAKDLVDTNDETSSTFAYNSGVKNVMREDGEPHEPGKYTEAILANAQETEDGYIKVKKILP